jgi:hypothetical protein
MRGWLDHGPKNPWLATAYWLFSMEFSGWQELKWGSAHHWTAARGEQQRLLFLFGRSWCRAIGFYELD